VSEAELDGLERDVIEARHRVAYDLDKLRSPGTVRQFKDELLENFRESKDALVERSVASGKQTARDLVENVKQRAMANPAAVLSIGAGIAWHLLRRPPITSVLVGLGLVSLFRTPPAGPNQDVRENLWQQASSAARYAGELGQEAGARVAETVQSGLEQARVAVHDATAAVGDVLSETRLTAPAAAAQVPLDKDQMLLGAAALSVTAAVAIAISRRGDEYNEEAIPGAELGRR
jgi:hypothetical protein